MGTCMTKGFISSIKPIMSFNWTVIFSRFDLGDPAYFSSRDFWTLHPHPWVCKAQLNIPQLDHFMKATPNWWQPLWWWKTHHVHQQIKIPMGSSPTAVGWWSHTPPGLLCSLRGFCQKTLGLVAQTLLPVPWTKSGLYCSFWGNENKTQVPCSKRRYEDGKCGIQGCNKCVYSCAVCS